MWFNIILPSVFPYLILSRYLAESDIADIVLRFPGKLISRFLNVSYPSLRCVLCSVLCGYPAGAIAASALEKNGDIERDEAERVIYYSNNAGPLFLISAVGGGMLGSQRLGFVIYLIELISAFAYGAMFKGKYNAPYRLEKTAERAKFDLCSAVAQSITVITNIFGFMASAFVMSRICIILFEKILPTQNGADILIKGFFEISAGVKSAVSIKGNSMSFALVCGFVSWSGLSVILQIKSASNGLVSMKKLIYAKAVQGMMSFCLGYVYAEITGIERGTALSGNIVAVSLVCTAFIYIIKSIIKKEHSH